MFIMGTIAFLIPNKNGIDTQIVTLAVLLLNIRVISCILMAVILKMASNM